MNIAGSVALVAGGTSGLGLATAQRLQKEGAAVVLMARSAERGAKAIAELGHDVCFLQGDVERPEDVAGAIDAARSLGRLRIAVVCAGSARTGRVLGRGGPLPLEDFAAIVRTNVVGTFNVVRLAAAEIANSDLDDAERGVIVCTSSIAAFDGQQGQAAYAASKAAIVGMTLPLARDLASRAIRVVTLAPGLFDTPMLAALPDSVRAALVEGTPHPRRLGDPAEFAMLVAHVVENAMINGEVIRLDAACRLPSSLHPAAR